MLVTAENTRNDVWRPLNYEKPPKIRRFSYQSATVGLPIVNQSCHVDDWSLQCGTRLVAVLSRLYLEGFWELEGAVETEQCCPCILQAYQSAWNGFQYAPRFSAPRKCWKLSFFKQSGTDLAEPHHMKRSSCRCLPLTRWVYGFQSSSAGFCSVTFHAKMSIDSAYMFISGLP